MPQPTDFKGLLYYLSIGLIVTLSINCKDDFLPTEEFPPLPPIERPTDNCFLLSFKLDGANCAFDAPSNTYFHPIPNLELVFSPLIEIADTAIEMKINNQLISNQSKNDLGNFKVNQAIPIEVKTCDNKQYNFSLILTNLPIVQINTTDEQTIPNEPKIPATFQLNDPNYNKNGFSDLAFSSSIGIETRGANAQGFEKKAYAFELRESLESSKEISAPLLGFRNDDDWILDAMFIDPARMRNRVSTDIWLDLEQVYYQEKEPKAKSATNGKMVEVFLNDNYQGIYFLTERIDRKQLKIKKFKDEKTTGFLYKSAGWSAVSKFKEYSPYDPNKDTWEGWEQKHPDPIDDGIFWTPLADFTRFVIESTDADFKATIEKELVIDNAVNYFLLLNLIRADDNSGKNIYLAKYSSNEPFFIVPWDLDATWGLFWDRTRTGTEIILQNGLFNRLIATNAGDFRTKIKTRWSTLRTSIFSQENLMKYFEKYGDVIKENGAFDREKQRWEMENSIEEELAYIEDWIGERLVYLDDYFGDL